MYSNNAVLGERWVGFTGSTAVVTTERCGDEVAAVFGVDFGACVVAAKRVDDLLAVNVWQVL